MAVDLKPTSGMAEAARTGLRLHNEGKSGDGLKPETVRRANIIAARQELTEAHVREMNAWFARHEADRRPGWNKPGEETPGFVAWMLWGGDAGRLWSADKIEQMDREESERSESMDATNIERRDWEFAEDGGAAVETRADGRMALTGYAVRYNTLSVDLGGFRESIMPGAFDKVLNRQRGKQDVVALFNHDANQLLGRTSSGTLELSSDDKGLRYSVVLPNTELGRTVAELVARGDLRGSSFAFTVEPRGEQWAPGEDGKPRRSIREVSGLFDVSVVTHPAYSSSTTAIARRSMNEWLASQEAEERCQCQQVEPEEAASAPAVDPKAIAVRLKAAVLRTFLRGYSCSERAFCATGSGGGIDNSCSSTEGGGGGGGGGDGGGGGQGGDSGGSGKGSGSGPGGLKSPSGSHNVQLPKSKSRLTIDQSNAALKQLGYKVGKSQTKKVGKGWVTMVEVTDSSGHTANLTADEVKDLVYDNAK
jgi:HK97 family phage prohead protease